MVISALNEKLGFYECNEIKFESKIQAFLYSDQVKKEVNWFFNDNVFNTYPWHIEPLESLDDLYDLRARQLREQYDYLILSFSGGADSNNILQSFIRQNLFIDEIVINTMEKGSEKFTILDSKVKDGWNTGAEHHLQTIPRLKESEKFLSKTKITILDLTDHLFNTLEKSKDESWIFDKREKLNPIGITRFNYIHFDEVRKQFDKNKKIAIILGIDKPKTLISKNKFYLRFNDRTANMVSIVNHFKDYTNSTVEYFYWDPSCTKMLCKQAHVIKRWLEIAPQYKKIWDVDTTTYKLVVLEHERLLRNIIYTNWNPDWFQVDKPESDWFCEFDHWFIKGFQGTRANQIWHRGINFASEILSNHLRRNSQGNPDGLKLFTKKYFIGDFNLSI
jgi:hypothetical protein